MGTWAGEGGNLTDSSYTKPQSTTTSWLSYSRPLNMLKSTSSYEMVILPTLSDEPHAIDACHLSARFPPCHARGSWSGACGHAFEHQRLDIPRAATLQCRFPQVSHANFSRCEDDNGVQHPQGSRDSPAGGAQSRAAREAPMYDFTQLTPTVLTLISGRRIPVTKVTEMRWWSKLGGDGRPTVPNHRAVRKGRRLGFCIDQDPPMGSPFGSRHAKKWRSSR